MDDFTFEIKKELRILLERVPNFEKYLFRLDYMDFPWEFLGLFEDAKFPPANPPGAWPCKTKGLINSGRGCRQKEFSALYGPIILGRNVTIDHYVKIRPFTIIGDNCNIGAFCEIKNSIILPNTNIPHHNYVGDSIIGKNCNLGSGTKISNLRLDERTIRVKYDDKIYDTKRKKFGAILEDHVHTGCNVVLNPGTYLKKNTVVYIDPDSFKQKCVK